MGILDETMSSISRSLTGRSGPLAWRVPSKDYARLCQEMSDAQAEAGSPVFFQGPNGLSYVAASERIKATPGLLVAGVPVYPYEVS